MAASPHPGQASPAVQGAAAGRAAPRAESAAARPAIIAGGARSMLPLLPLIAGVGLGIVLFLVAHFRFEDANHRVEILTQAEEVVFESLVARAGGESPRGQELMRSAAGTLAGAGFETLAAALSSAGPALTPAEVEAEFSAARASTARTGEFHFLAFGASSLAVLVCGVGGSFYLWRRRWTSRWQRVERLDRVLVRIATTPVSETFRPAPGSDELASIEQSLARMSRQLRDSFIHLDRLARMGEHVAFVAHDIRNPLMAIQLTLEMEIDDPLAADDRHALAREAARAIEMASELRNFSRKEGIEESIDLASMVREVVPALERRYAHQGARAKYAVEGKPMTRGRQQELRQVLMNLVENAFDAIGDGDRKEVHVLAAPTPDGGVLLAVEDSGPGVPEARRNEVFSSFVTSKAHGTGLGLAICREIVTAHGGEIRISQAQYLGGARFEVLLPPGPKVEPPLSH